MVFYYYIDIFCLNISFLSIIFIFFSFFNVNSFSRGNNNLLPSVLSKSILSPFVSHSNNHNLSVSSSQLSHIPIFSKNSLSIFGYEMKCSPTTSSFINSSYSIKTTLYNITLSGILLSPSGKSADIIYSISDLFLELSVPWKSVCVRQC